MPEFSMLTAVKTGLGLQNNNNFDSVLNFYIVEVGQYMKAAGVRINFIASADAAGIITRGVADLWNYGSGNAALSPYFMERVIQSAITYPADSPTEDVDIEPIDSGFVNSLFEGE